MAVLLNGKRQEKKQLSKSQTDIMQNLKIMQKINLITQTNTYFVGVSHTFPWVRPTAISVEPFQGGFGRIF